jgi:DNA (cytosine-5)-methyltransferase 1
MNHKYYEFFAGGGMARLGLGPTWQCLLANDIDPKKMKSYKANFGEEGAIECDISDLGLDSLPGSPMLAWASFPCQDLSLAGNRMGLSGERSGTFWGFWSIINNLKLSGRAPPLLVLENVCGLLTSHDGKDFRDLCRALASLGYTFGAVVVDAVHFLPQSRPRLFIICTQDKRHIPNELFAFGPNDIWHSQSLRLAVHVLPKDLMANWIWWNLPETKTSGLTLEQLLELDAVGGPPWNSREQTNDLLAMMSQTNREKVEAAQLRGGRVLGTIYKRTRVENGERFQRAEVRFDGIAGCLRAPGGGSSRQTIILVDGGLIKTRLIGIREAARLMGVPDTYIIPDSYNEGYHIFGDGLAVPAVAHIARNLLDPIAEFIQRSIFARKKLAA